MTDFRGIAAATQTLVQVLSTAVQGLDGARISQLRPEDQAASGQDDARLNVYLVQVRVDPTLRSSDLPMRNDKGQLLSTPRVPLIARYILTFFGKHPVPQLMLGAAESALHVNAVFTPELVRRAVQPYEELHGSGLDVQQPPVQILPASVPLEQMSHFWSGFFSVPYTLSTFYDLSAIHVEASALPTLSAGLPVKQSGRGTPPSPATPVGGLGPLLAPLPATALEPGSEAPVTGERLTADMRIRVADRWLELREAADGRLSFTLPGDTQPGTYEAVLGDHQDKPIPGSPAQALAVRPRAQAPEYAVHRIGQSTVQEIVLMIDPPPRPADLATLSIELVALSGSGWSTSVAGTRVPGTRASFRFTFPAFKAPEPPFIPPGDYVAMVSVAGVTSLPTMVAGRYRDPEVTVP